MGNILAGQGTNGGVLRIIPGDADQDSGDQEEQADIILGNPDNHLLRITRSVANNNAGVTTLAGQDTTLPPGGDFFLKAGDARHNGNGGSLHLLPGSRPGQAPTFADAVSGGSIFVGDLVDDLTITREARFGGGLDTYIMGQESAATQGGDLFFLGGNGQDIGGDVRVVGGLSLGADSNAQSVGGGIIIESGNGQINGGNINIYGGSGTTAGGSVLITTDSTGASGDIYLSAGSGPTMGDITIGDEALLFTLDGDFLTVHDSYIRMESGVDNIEIRADSSSILSYNGRTILRSVSDYPVPLVPQTTIVGDTDFSETAYRLGQIQNSIEILVNALSQCQMGIFQTVNPNGTPDSCEAFA